MTHADDVGIDLLKPSGPGLRVFEQVFVQGVAGRGVHQQKPRAPKRQALGDRKLEQVPPLVGTQSFPDRRTRDPGQVAIADAALDQNALRDAVIVVAANGVGGVVHGPSHARERVRTVVDQVA